MRSPLRTSLRTARIVVVRPRSETHAVQTSVGWPWLFGAPGPRDLHTVVERTIQTKGSCMPSIWCAHCGGYVNHDSHDVHHRMLDARITDGATAATGWPAMRALVQGAAAFAATIVSFKPGR